MSHRSNVISARLAQRVANFCRWVGERLFAEPDADARSRGWEVSPRWGGLSRTYRDPRFNLRIPCSQCGGAVAIFPGGICTECEARARLLLDQYAEHNLQARLTQHAEWNQQVERNELTGRW
jgi:hypothetical protein